MANIRNLLTLFLMVCLVLIMAACGSNDDTAKESNSETPPAETSGNNQPANETPPAPKAPEPAELTFYTVNLNTEEHFNETMGNGLRKKFPHFTIKFLNGNTGGSIESMVLNNTHFDIYFSTAGRPEEITFRHGFAFDISDLIKKHNVDLTAFDPAFQDVLGPAYGGKTYFLPYIQTGNILFYNKDVFDRFGVGYPRNGMTWDELYDMNRKVTKVEGGVQYLGYRPNVAGIIRSNPLSIPLVQAGTLAPTINTDNRWQTFFQRYMIDAVRGIEPEVLQTLRANSGQFFEGTLGIYPSADSLLQSNADNLSKLNFDISSYPVLEPSSRSGPQALMYNIAITNKATNKDAAMEALKYIVSEEHQRFLSIAGTGSVLKNPEIRKLQATGVSVAKGKNLEALSYNNLAPLVHYGVAAESMRAIYGKHMEKLITEGQTDYNTLFRQAEEEAVKLAEEIKATITVEGVLR